LNSGAIDTEYVILENIYASSRQRQSLRQRDLAQLAKTSLGMTNSILKRLAQKGWITAQKFNSRNVQYAVTLEGINEIIHRSYGYFKRTIKNIACYKDAIDEVIRGAAAKKMKAVLLIGSSDLEFIVEHSCHYYGLSFLKSADKTIGAASIDRRTMVFFSEDIPQTPELPAKNSCFLSQLVIKIAAVS
jgi:DNA-binding MarR family transcriptional regulator